MEGFESFKALGEKALRAEEYVRLIIKEWKEDVIETILSEQDLEKIKLKIGIARLLEDRINLDITRYYDLKNQK